MKKLGTTDTPWGKKNGATIRESAEGRRLGVLTGGQSAHEHNSDTGRWEHRDGDRFLKLLAKCTEKAMAIRRVLRKRMVKRNKKTLHQTRKGGETGTGLARSGHPK